MAGSRFRYVDYWHSRFLNSSTEQSRAVDEIINEPERHLLSQKDLFAAEGGVVGVFAQIGFIGATLATLFVVRPKLVTYLRNSQMNAGEWICLAGTGFIGYRLGYNFANTFFGDAEKVNNHWTAYFYQKQLNRFEGRQILSKRPGNY